MRTYDLRPNRPKTGDGYFRNLHLQPHRDDVFDRQDPQCRGPQKTRWLRGLAAHLQIAITRVTSDGAKGEKRVGKISLSNIATVTALKAIGIENKWVPCQSIVQLLNLETSFIKGDYIRRASRLEFKQVQKVGHYFDGQNQPRQTAAAYFLSFRLLKQTPQCRIIM